MMGCMLRLSLRIARDVFVEGLLWLALACPLSLRAAAGDNALQGLNPLTAPVSVLHTHIERETTKVARILSPEGRRVMHQSVNRFLNWAEGYCQGDAGCLRNQYSNYIAAIPNSVYRVGRWTVYNTGVYALEWADEDLQGMDPDRAFTWDLQLTWPHVDAAANPVQGHVALADSAYGALGARVHQLMAAWVKGGWNRFLDVHLEGMDDCYVSASITGSTYSGGAHPYEDFSTFNWNVRAKRALQNTDLFRADSDWKSEIIALYRQRLQASGTDLSQWTLSSDAIDALFTNGFVITAGGLRFVQHEGATRNENVPAVDLSWSDLAPWLVPEASCSMLPGDRPR
jgi:hypothetical protein